MTIFVPCIDPGHGGAALGATTDQWREKDLNLETCKRLNASLAGTEIVPVMTRQADYNPSWEARYNAAKESGARFVLSVHFNLNPLSAKPCGAEAYHWPRNDRTRQIAKAMIEAMPAWLKTDKVFAATDDPDPGDDWLQRPRMIIEAFRELPVLVAECCYLSNRGDAIYLGDRWTIDAIVCALRVAVVEAARLYSAPG